MNRFPQQRGLGRGLDSFPKDDTPGKGRRQLFGIPEAARSLQELHDDLDKATLAAENSPSTAAYRLIVESGWALVRHEVRLRPTSESNT